jgi:hypothetical protein
MDADENGILRIEARNWRRTAGALFIPPANI